MNVALWCAAVFGLMTAAGFILAFRKMAAGGQEPETDLGWCRSFSVAKYRPMERLFLEEDYEFLSAQPGFDPKIFKKLQAERRRVFRSYLRALARDFDRLLSAAKTLMLSSAQDRPDLARVLFRQRLIFQYALLQVHVRLALQTAGVGKVDVRPLVGALEALRDQLRVASQRAQVSVA